MTEFAHIPVMLRECIEGLAIKGDGIYVDCTLGGAGHSLEIASRLTTGKLIAFDKDADAIAFAKQRLAPYAERVTLLKDDFKRAPSRLKDAGITQLDGVLMDLGVSSYQLDSAERGFSYNADAPLDMRMDKDQYLTAFNVVNEYPEQRLADIIFEYGEERYARRIAREIVKVRQTETIATTAQLAEITERCYPPKERKGRASTCKRTFQAIRIEVNGELDGLKETIEQLSLMLRPGGRICVISFHSLEDRAVKTAFKFLEADCVCPPRQPICTCGKKREIKILTKKPLVASEEERESNSRSQSAKLRIAERIRA